jgi:hypothetical protein
MCCGGHPDHELYCVNVKRTGKTMNEKRTYAVEAHSTSYYYYEVEAENRQQAQDAWWQEDPSMHEVEIEFEITDVYEA